MSTLLIVLLLGAGVPATATAREEATREPGSTVLDALRASFDSDLLPMEARFESFRSGIEGGPTNAATEREEMKPTRFWGATAQVGDEIILIGGAEVWESGSVALPSRIGALNPGTGAIRESNEELTPEILSFATLSGGLVYTFGGCRQPCRGSDITSTVRVVDPVTLRVLREIETGTRLIAGTAVATPQGIFVVGGFHVTGDGPWSFSTGNVFRFDPVSGTLNLLDERTPAGFLLGSGIWTGREILFLPGILEASAPWTYYSELWRLDPQTGRVSAMQQGFQAPKVGGILLSEGDRILAVGLPLSYPRADPIEPEAIDPSTLVISPSGLKLREMAIWAAPWSSLAGAATALGIKIDIEGNARYTPDTIYLSDARSRSSSERSERVVNGQFLPSVHADVLAVRFAHHPSAPRYDVSASVENGPFSPVASFPALADLSALEGEYRLVHYDGDEVPSVEVRYWTVTAHDERRFGHEFGVLGHEAVTPVRATRLGDDAAWLAHGGRSATVEAYVQLYVDGKPATPPVALRAPIAGQAAGALASTLAG